MSNSFSSKLLVVGLGNPGKQYDDTPHNVGFAVVDAVREALGASLWKMDKKANALVSTTDDDQIMLAKPQTFMNESGTTVASLLQHQSSATLIVVHDDLALPLGTLRVGEFQSSGGHNGIESLLAHLGNRSFIRVRVGVLPPNGQPSSAEEYVTAKWQLRMDERSLIAPAIQRAAEATAALLTQSLEAVQNKYN
jgi:PTH1 family peptidyl-tRNA hydrolase